MAKIYTFRARSTTDGTISVLAETLEQAEAMRATMQENNIGEMNIEMGSGELFIDATGTEETDADDGTHYMDTPRQNAAMNAAALANYQEENQE